MRGIQPRSGAVADAAAEEKGQSGRRSIGLVPCTQRLYERRGLQQAAAGSLDREGRSVRHELGGFRRGQDLRLRPSMGSHCIAPPPFGHSV